MNEDIVLGNKVRDVVTNFEGIAVARVESLTGAIQYEVIPDQTTKGAFPASHYVSAARLKKIDDGVHVEKVKPVLGFHAGAVK